MTFLVRSTAELWPVENLCMAFAKAPSGQKRSAGLTMQVSLINHSTLQPTKQTNQSVCQSINLSSYSASSVTSSQPSQSIDMKDVAWLQGILSLFLMSANNLVKFDHILLIWSFLESAKATTKATVPTVSASSESKGVKLWAIIATALLSVLVVGLLVWAVLFWRVRLVPAALHSERYIRQPLDADPMETDT